MENFNTGINNLSNNIQNNNEVQVDAAELMKALKHFNWGAFLFTWMWGLGNGSFSKTWPIIILQVFVGLNEVFFKMGTFGAFLMITMVLLILCFAIYYGLNGNQWAYQNRAWWSIEDYENTQKRWATAAAVMISIFVVAVLIGLLLGMLAVAALFGGKVH